MGVHTLDYELLNLFQAKIVDVGHRQERFWENLNYEINREVTQRHVLAYVYEGAGEMELDGKGCSLISGSLFYVPPGSRMKIMTEQQSLLKFYSVLFQYGQLRWEGESSQWSSNLINPIFEKTVTYFDENPTLLDQYSDLFTLWNRKGIGYEWKAKLHFQQLLDVLIQMIHDSSEHLQRNAILIEQTIEYIRNHLRDRLDRTALAERVSLSVGYFSTLFKQHTGYSLVEYITRLRLDRAKTLLRETRLPIYKVSEEVGYVDSFYFTRQFNKDTGMSPREFRQYYT